MREGYQFGGEYYCHECKMAHHSLSEIGKEHIRYASAEMRKIAFKERGIY